MAVFIGGIKKNPCWKGYRMIGTKRKGNKIVPNCVVIGGLKYSKFDAIEELEAGGYDFDKSYFAQNASAGLLEDVRKRSKYTYRGGSGKSQARAFFDSLKKHYDKYK